MGTVPTATGRFYRSKLYFVAKRIDEHLVRWAMRKRKRFDADQVERGNG